MSSTVASLRYPIIQPITRHRYMGTNITHLTHQRNPLYGSPLQGNLLHGSPVHRGLLHELPDKPSPWKPTPDKPIPCKPTLDKLTPWTPTPDKPTPWKPTPDKPTHELMLMQSLWVHLILDSSQFIYEMTNQIAANGLFHLNYHVYFTIPVMANQGLAPKCRTLPVHKGTRWLSFEEIFSERRP